MSSLYSNSGDTYKPDYQISPGPRYSWPPRPLAILYWLFIDM